MLNNRFRSAWPAAAWHLLGSALIALAAAVLVFFVWYPYPYRDLVGGRELFLLVVSVDVVCGPLLTLVLFNPSKSRRELVLDLSLVATIQLAALVYGLFTVAQARPVYLAFESDRFRAVTYSDVHREALQPEKGGLHVLGWGGPRVIGVRLHKDNEEMMKSLDLSLGGITPAMRPDWWVPYQDVKERVLQKAQGLDSLRTRRPMDKALIDAAVDDSGLPDSRLVWLPVTSFQSTGWVALLDRDTADVLSFAPLDGF